MVVTSNLLNSRVGRAIRALRAGAVAAESFGVDTARSKLIIFVYAALLAGLSGWLFAHFQRAISPSAFGVNLGIEYLFMAVLGGAGHVFGAVLGAAIVAILKDQLQNLLPRILGDSGNFDIIVFGVLLLLIMQTARDGLWPFVRRLFPQGAPPADPADAPALVRRERPPRDSVLLEVRDLTKLFGGLVAVSGVSFGVRAGEIVGLIGPNGAGKTTTFNLITGLAQQSSGEVRFLDRQIDGMAARHISRLGIARTFQHVKLVPDMTVLENVALGAHLRGRAGVVAAMLRGDRAEDGRLLREAARQLERVGLAELMHRPAASLALGQSRIVEIARALCLDPLLLLLDEPAAGLRHREKAALAVLLRRLRDEGIGILLVEHDMDFVMGLTDRLIVLDFGALIAEGKPGKVRREPAVIEAYLGGVE
jgi:branched-chain amino acid transport system permease protein